MSIEAYKIAVKISLVENVTRGLTAMSAHFARTHQDAKALESRLASIGKMALLGGGLATAGGAGLKVLEHPLQKAIEYERQLAVLRQQGLGDGQIEEARKFSDAQKIMGQSRLDMIRHFTEAQGAFRESGMDGEHALHAAKVMTPVLAQYEAASEMLSGHTKAAAHQAMQNLNKTVEIMGGISDPKRAAEIASGVFKAVQSSGRMVDERQLKQFVAYGSSATNSMEMRAIFGGLEPIIGEFGGSTVATGLRTAFTRMSGAMAMPPKKMQGLLQELGIGKLDHGSYRMNDDLLSFMQRDAAGFAKKMMSVYDQNGITTTLDRERTNAQLFGTNGAKIYNKIMQQMDVIDKSMLAYDRALDPSKAVSTPEGKRLSMLKDYHKKVEDLQLSFGQSGGLLDMTLSVLKRLNPMLETLAKWIRENATLVKVLTVAFVGLSILAVIGGGVLLLKAAFGGLGLLMPSLTGSVLTLGTSFTLAAAKTALLSIALKVGLVAAIGFAIYEVFKLGGALKDLWDVKHREGAKLTQSAQDRIKNMSPIERARFDALDSDFKGFKKLPHGGMASTGTQNSYIRTTPPVVNVTVTNQVNERGITSMVVKNMTREITRSATGGSRFDPTIGVPPVGMNYDK